MTAWAQDQKVVGSIINFVADPRAEATMALGLAINEPPEKFGYYPRTKRFAMILKDGVVKKLNVCETPTDATGDSVAESGRASGRAQLRALKDGVLAKCRFRRNWYRFRMRRDASGCVRMPRYFEFQQISANSGKLKDENSGKIQGKI